MPSTVPIEMPSSKAPASILIIDDIPQIHNFLAIHLRSESYTIHRAVSGLEGLEIVRTRHVDLVLLDIGLPDISGFEVLKQLKADPRYASIPVVILTIRDLTENIVRALELGAHDYVTKPFEPAELRARVKSAIAMKFFREKLEQSRKQFVTMINSLAEVVFQLTLDGDINFVNSTWEEMSGYSVKDSLLVSLFDFLHADDAATVRRYVEALSSGEQESVKFEARFLNAEEQVFWGEIRLRSLFDDREQLSGFAGTLIDITQKKAAQEELELRSERFRLLIENSDNVVFTVNETGRIQYAGSSIVHVLNCSPGATEGQSLLSLVHEDDRFAVKSALAACVAGSDEGEPVEARLVCDNGNYRECEIVMRNLLHSPPVGGVVVTLRVVGERKQERRELRMSTRVLDGIHQSLHLLREREGDSTVLSESLGILAMSVDADGGNILLCAGGEDEPRLVPVSEWTRDRDIALPHEEFVALPPTYWLDMLARRQAVVLDRTTPHAPVAEFLERWSIGTVLILPIVTAGMTVGLLCTYRVARAGEWCSVERTALDIAACGLGSLLMDFSGPASYIRTFLRGAATGTARQELPPL